MSPIANPAGTLKPCRTKTAAYVPDLTAFAFTLALAWYLDWQATDLVWGLWLSSLLVGYLVMLSQILRVPLGLPRA